MRTLVLGATGFVGSALVERLVAAGDTVRAASRGVFSVRGAGPAGSVESVHCDLRTPATLPAALRGIDTVYYLVHSMGVPGADFQRVERQCARDLAAAAATAGCTRIVYLGGVAPQGRPSRHLASRLEVGEILREGRVPTLELRASMILGNGSVSWRIVRDLGVRLPVMILPRWLESRSCPIALPDVVEALLEGRRIPMDSSAWFDIPGPETLTARDMLERVARLRGRRVLMVRVPVLTPQLSALWLKLVTGANYAIARELVLGLAEDLLPKDRRYWDLIGHRDLQPFDIAAQRAMESERPPSLAVRVEERIAQRIGEAIASRARDEAPR